MNFFSKLRTNASAFSKTVGLALVAFTGIAFSSCGGDPNSVTLEVKPELGDLGNFMTIDSKEAKLSLSEATEDGVPCFKLSSTLQITVSKAVASSYGFDLEVEFLDKDMNRVASVNFEYDIESETDYDNGDFDHILKAGNYRAVIDETIKKSDWDAHPEAQQNWDLIREKAKYIVLKPEWTSSNKFVEYKGNAGTSSDDEVVEDATEDDSVASVGTTDWDKILDEYEAYCNKVAALSKKAMAGDASAITEYSSLVESAESLENKLNNAKGELSTAQAARLNKIAAKMAQSMM